MATDEILAFNSQNNQNEIIRSLAQDVKLTVNVNFWQQELTRVFNEIEIPRLGEQDVHELNLLHKAK